MLTPAVASESYTTKGTYMQNVFGCFSPMLRLMRVISYRPAVVDEKRLTPRARAYTTSVRALRLAAVIVPRAQVLHCLHQQRTVRTKVHNHSQVRQVSYTHVIDTCTTLQRHIALQVTRATVHGLPKYPPSQPSKIYTHVRTSLPPPYTYLPLSITKGRVQVKNIWLGTPPPNFIFATALRPNLNN